jgi:hypothetical protein
MINIPSNFLFLAEKNLLNAYEFSFLTFIEMKYLSNFNYLVPIEPNKSIQNTSNILQPHIIDLSKSDRKIDITNNPKNSHLEDILHEEIKPNNTIKQLEEFSQTFQTSDQPTLPNQHNNCLNNFEYFEKFLNEVKKFESHVNSLQLKTLATLTLLEKEWKELNDYQDKQSTQMTISVARCYPNKNRYPDLLPFDQTRVILPNRKSDNDYINASHIGQLSYEVDSKLLKLQPSFIVSQLPILSLSLELNSQLNDFWSMIFHNQIECLVCLCRDNEFVMQNTHKSQVFVVVFLTKYLY